MTRAPARLIRVQNIYASISSGRNWFASSKETFLFQIFGRTAGCSPAVPVIQSKFKALYNLLLVPALNMSTSLLILSIPTIWTRLTTFLLFICQWFQVLKASPSELQMQRLFQSRILPFAFVRFCSVRLQAALRVHESAICSTSVSGLRTQRSSMWH
jgi:hypothetical protein